MGDSIDRELQWYTRRDNVDAEKGPVRRAVLVEAVLRGETRPDVQVRREDQGEWSTLAEHPAFQAGLTGWRSGGSGDDQNRDVADRSKASPTLWLIAVVACVVHVVLASGKGTENWGTRVLTAILGACVWPLLIIGLDSIWPSHRNQRRWVTVFAVTSVALVTLRFGSGFLSGYLGDARTAEARNTVNEIAQRALDAFERDRLCGSAQPVPSQLKHGYLYPPSDAPGTDYDVGDKDTGWQCLHFKMTAPQKYQYEYTAGGPYKGPARGGPNPGPGGFEVSAEGDIDGNGTTSLFTRTGTLEPSGRMVLSSEIFVSKEFE